MEPVRLIVEITNQNDRVHAVKSMVNVRDGFTSRDGVWKTWLAREVTVNSQAALSGKFRNRFPMQRTALLGFCDPVSLAIQQRLIEPVNLLTQNPIR